MMYLITLHTQKLLCMLEVLESNIRPTIQVQEMQPATQEIYWLVIRTQRSYWLIP